MIILAGSILRMIHNSLGDDLFFNALHEYLEKNKFGSSRPEYLSEAFQNQLVSSNKNPGNLSVHFQDVFFSWIDQVGYPVVNATFKDGTIKFSQVSLIDNIKKNFSFFFNNSKNFGIIGKIFNKPK